MRWTSLDLDLEPIAEPSAEPRPRQCARSAANQVVSLCGRADDKRTNDSPLGPRWCRGSLPKVALRAVPLAPKTSVVPGLPGRAFELAKRRVEKWLNVPLA